MAKEAGAGSDVKMNIDEGESSQEDESLATGAKLSKLNMGGISDEVRQDIESGHDCYLHDEELLGAKKNLTGKFTPLSIVSQLKAKLPPSDSARISESKITETKDAETQRSLWHFSIGYLE